MTDNELWQMPATDLIEGYRTRRFSPVEVTEAVLNRASTLISVLNPFITFTPELALENAKAAETAWNDESAGALAGVPLSIKDITVTKGIPTTRGSRIFENYVADFDSPLAERLFQAGGVMLGKTSTPEFGWKGETTNPVTGSTQNPWQIGRTPGGSSGGAAAAVASGIGPISQGSDGAGSIRVPCSFTGLFGLKPSYGLVPYYPGGAVGDLTHGGPISRTVADAALMLNVVAGADLRDRHSWSSGVDYLTGIEKFDISGWKIAWVPRLVEGPIDPEVLSIVSEAAKVFADLGAYVTVVAPDLGDPWPLLDTIWASGMAGMHLHNLEQWRDQIDPGRLAVIERGQKISAAELVDAQNRRSAFVEQLRHTFSEFDLILLPSAPCTAFPTGLDMPESIDGEPTEYLKWMHYTYPFNFTGQPAATVPAGFDHQGLPVGLQIVGQRQCDLTVLQAARAFEIARPWAHLWPQLPV